MKYSVCASAVFGKMPLADAIRETAKAGYRACEFWSWWDQDLDAVAAAVAETGLEVAGICTRMVPLNDPARREEYLQGLKESVCAAKRLGCSRLISQVGQAIEGVDRQAQHDCIVEGLRACASILEKENIELVIEPLNTLVNHIGYYLDRSDEAFEIVREVNSPKVKVLFDIYHQQITEGNLIENITRNIDLIGHIHIAGNPGRHEPHKNSEVHYPTVLAALKRAGYCGYVGLEYFPLEDARQGLEEILNFMPL